MARPTYGQLGELLHRLGFSDCSEPDQFLGYEHPATETIFRFAPHALNEDVIEHDLVRVRRMLDLLNLFSVEDFDAWRLSVSESKSKSAG